MPVEPAMFSQEIELRGHIIDALILPKVLDEILSRGGHFKIRQIQIGQERTDPSYARIEVFGPSPEAVDELVRRLRQHGAELIEEGDVKLAQARPCRRSLSPGFLRHHQSANLRSSPWQMDRG